MTNNPTGFKITDEAAGWNRADFDDVFVRKDCFLEGGLWLWGYGFKGGLGNNTAPIGLSSPVQTISGGTNWRTVSAGDSLSTAIKTDGTLWLWGEGGQGQLGNNAATNRSSPVQTISGGTNWRNVSAGSNTAAIKTDGTLWLWGAGTSGQLGNNAAVSLSSPVQTISGGTNWQTVSAGNVHIAAIKTDGTLWTWGSNAQGRLGNNAAVSQSSPVQTISGGTSWRSVSSLNAHTAAIKTDGTLWTWGFGNQGQLGNNAAVSQSSPVQTISGGTSWRSVSAGGFHIAAIKTDGTLWLWGENTRGILGNNTIANQSSPVQTISGGTNWRIICNGCCHSTTIKTDGTLWTWGYGGIGQLGNNAAINQSSPVQTISGGTSWRRVAGIGFMTAAIREDCW